MMNAEKGGSLTSKFAKFLGLSLLASILAGCGSSIYEKVLNAGPGPAPKASSISEKDSKSETTVSLEEITGKEGQDKKESSIGYTHNESSSNSSDAFNARFRNMQNLGKNRWQLDLDVVDAENYVEAEERASGDFYLNSSGQTGVGAGFKASDRQLEGRIAGHYSWDKGRIYGHINTGKREDATEVNSIETNVDNEYFGGGLSLRLRVSPRLNLNMGGNYNINEIECTINGLPVEQEDKTDSEALSGYAVLSRNASNGSGAGYIGVISSRIEITDPDGINEAETTDNTTAIGGYQFRVAERTTLMPRVMLGDQRGGGLDIIVGPAVSTISNLYAQLREIEKTQGKESDPYKTLVREIEQAVQNAGTHTLSLSGQENTENNATTYEARYNYTMNRGSRVGLGARHTSIPVSGADDIDFTDIMLNCELRWGKNAVILDFTVPVEDMEHDEDRTTQASVRYTLRF